MMIRTILLFALLTLMLSPALAQSDQVPPVPFHPKLSIETDILWPIFPGAFRGHLLFNLWQRGQLRGDVYVGVNYDFPQDRTTEGRFSDLSLASGYRQYLWEGLHIEFSQTMGIGTLENHVSTGEDYRSFDWLVTGYVGYKFNFARNKLYLLPQFGLAGVIYKSNPWPVFEDESLRNEVGETPFPLGSLRFGYNF